MARPTRKATGPGASAPAARTGAPSGAYRPAWRSGASVGVFLAAGGAGLVADLLSKHLVFAALIHRQARSATVIPGLLRLTLSTNPGIVFGIRLPPWLVLLTTVAAVAAVTFLFATSPRRSVALHLGLGMILGGALGNAFDRILVSVHFPGEPAARVRQVRDFLDVYPINYPVFNVADMLLVVGVGLVVAHMLRARRARPG